MEKGQWHEKIDQKYKYKTTNSTVRDNYIMNLFGLSAWWDRVCRPDKGLKCQAKQSNQNAKLRFMSNFSPSTVAGQRKEPGKSANLTDELIRGKITPKRFRDDDISTGENPRKKAKKMNLQNILDQADSAKVTDQDLTDYEEG